MVIVCGIGIMLIIMLYLCTIPYKKTFRKKLNKKQHKLIRLYGIAMFIADKIPKKIMHKSNSVDKALMELKVKENIQREKYLYIVEKTSISLLVILTTFIFGAVSGISAKIERAESIKELRRDRSQIRTYEFVAEREDGHQEQVKVDVNNEELTNEEIYKLFEKVEEQLIDEVLDENESVEKVNRPLNLVSSIGDGISVAWKISDSSIIDYEGKISDKVQEQGVVIDITATMMLENIYKDYTFSLNVFPCVEGKSLQQQLQEYVNENYKYDETVQLPKEISGQTIKYFCETQDISGWLVLMGIVASAGIFILKDQDLKKDIKKRNHQMLADYPEILEKILLYHNAGLSLKSGIERIVAGYKKDKEQDKKLFRYAYEELEITLIKMKSGISEVEAINEYGNRCGLHCYIKLAGIIEQNLRRGSREVSYALKNELNSAMFDRKNAALKEGGEMSTKILGPMLVMLIISIVIIMVPALWSMNI